MTTDLEWAYGLIEALNEGSAEWHERKYKAWEETKRLQDLVLWGEEFVPYVEQRLFEYYVDDMTRLVLRDTAAHPDLVFKLVKMRVHERFYTFVDIPETPA
jgi:hypothetical protein